MIGTLSVAVGLALAPLLQPELESFFDEDALFPTPLADWDDGLLTAAFDFAGNGGPGGEFDWLVKSGETFLFDTEQADWTRFFYVLPISERRALIEHTTFTARLRVRTNT